MLPISQGSENSSSAHSPQGAELLTEREMAIGVFVAGLLTDLNHSPKKSRRLEQQEQTAIRAVEGDIFFFPLEDVEKIEEVKEVLRNAVTELNGAFEIKQEAAAALAAVQEKEEEFLLELHKEDAEEQALIGVCEIREKRVAKIRALGQVEVKAQAAIEAIEQANEKIVTIYREDTIIEEAIAALKKEVVAAEQSLFILTLGNEEIEGVERELAALKIK